MYFQGVMSGKEANKNPGLCPSKGQLSFRIPSKEAFPPGSPRTAPVERDASFPEPFTVSRIPY